MEGFPKDKHIKHYVNHVYHHFLTFSAYSNGKTLYKIHLPLLQLLRHLSHDNI